MDTNESESWRSALDTWACPGCYRRKAECEVKTKSGRTLRQLVGHHDHMRDYVKDYLLRQYGSWQSVHQKHLHPREFAFHIDLIKKIAQRFKHTLVCIDCNEIEGKIKKEISADKFFSFHPSELNRALIRASNQRHLFVVEHMQFYRDLYERVSHRLVVERKRVIRQLVDSAVEGNLVWGGPVDLERVFPSDVYDRLGRDYPSFDSAKRLQEGLENGTPVLRGAAWYPHEEEELRRLVGEGTEIGEIARSLGRTSTGIRLRMEKLGLAQASTESSRS